MKKCTCFKSLKRFEYPEPLLLQNAGRDEHCRVEKRGSPDFVPFGLKIRILYKNRSNVIM